MFEKNALMLGWPAPSPPLARDPNAGSLAEPRPDTNDKDYVAQREIHKRQMAVLDAAVSIGYAPAPLEAGIGPMAFHEAVQAGRSTQWCKATLVEWEGTADRPGRFAEAHVMQIRTALRELEGVGGLGNSSAPSVDAGATTTKTASDGGSNAKKTPA